MRQQGTLKRLMSHPEQFTQFIELLLQQHAHMHSAGMEPTGLWSFEDAVLDDLPLEAMRRQPARSPHSLVWLVWHMARCEDITMNLLVAGQPQVLLSGNWLPQLGVECRDTGNEMSAAELEDFNHRVDITALRLYRQAVGRSTRQIVRGLTPEDLKRKVDPERLARVHAEGAVLESARYQTDYWGKRTFGELLLMPASRHLLIHWNEAVDVVKE